MEEKMFDKPFKTCSCGRSFSREQWSQLDFVGIWKLDEFEIPLELRNCLCGSTIAIKIAPTQKEKEDGNTL